MFEDSNLHSLLENARMMGYDQQRFPPVNRIGDLFEKMREREKLYGIRSLIDRSGSALPLTYSGQLRRGRVPTGAVQLS